METNIDSKSIIEEPKSVVDPTVQKQKVIFVQMKVNQNCSLLNVRKEPSLKSDIICELKQGTVLNINLEKSTEEFYYVASQIIDTITKNPIHGYSKKEFISEV